MLQEIKLGDILKINSTEQIIRVIALDDIEVLYDFYWNHNDKWAFADNLSKKGFFYRMSLKNCISKCSKVDYKSLSDKEHMVLRPDLRLRFLRDKNASWQYDYFKEKKNEIQNTFSNQFLPINKIFLCPLSKNKSIKKGEILESNNQEISFYEILVKAFEMSKKIGKTDSNGIGIYRLGIEKGVPSFYIGDYIDIAGIMKTSPYGHERK